jgi:hypothetical protein
MAVVARQSWRGGGRPRFRTGGAWRLPPRNAQQKTTTQQHSHAHRGGGRTRVVFVVQAGSDCVVLCVVVFLWGPESRYAAQAHVVAAQLRRAVPGGCGPGSGYWYG